MKVEEQFWSNFESDLELGEFLKHLFDQDLDAGVTSVSDQGSEYRMLSISGFDFWPHLS